MILVTGKRKKIYSSGILFFIICFLFYILSLNSIINALPQKRKINSVKSLTYILSNIEKENGNSAVFVTLKLQIYLEDIYISQGTAVILYPDSISKFIKKMISESKSKDEIAKEILKRFKDGDFND